MTEKIIFPDFIVDKLENFIQTISDEGQFFEDPMEFSDKESVEIGKVHLWNMLGKEYLDKYLKDSEEIYFTPDELHSILVHVIIQTNLDLLMKDKLIDGIEDENGEMRYWLTNEGKNVYKSLGGD